MASHSSAYTVAANKRNLKDEQIKAIAEKGGAIGLNLYPYYLNNTKTAGLDDILAHIRHMNKLGVMDYIGLGCDFDGIGVTPVGFSDVTSLKTLPDSISAAFGDDIARSVMYKNFIDFYERFFERD
jgi:membrane dipeptidase